jgi:hypothetical protein
MRHARQRSLPNFKFHNRAAAHAHASHRRRHAKPLHPRTDPPSVSTTRTRTDTLRIRESPQQPSRPTRSPHPRQACRCMHPPAPVRAQQQSGTASCASGGSSHAVHSNDAAGFADACKPCRCRGCYHCRSKQASTAAALPKCCASATCCSKVHRRPVPKVRTRSPSLSRHSPYQQQ